MTTLGIIVEYNPFHNGHLYHLQQAKKMIHPETTIAVMSGSFVQRGEPAIVDKWTRTKMALRQGIDLVIELPTIFAIQSADWFAFGAISILEHLKVDHLVFGSESDSISSLYQIAHVLYKEPDSFKNRIKEALSLGHSYPKALSLSLESFLEQDHVRLKEPNDLLGLQYLIQLKKLNSKIQAHTIQRKSVHYHEPMLNYSDSFASATAIRKNILSTNRLDQIEPVVPSSTYHELERELQHQRIHSWDHFFPFLQFLLTTKSHSQLKEIHGIEEGIEYRLKEYAFTSSNFEELIQSIKTKRYTRTKLQRMLLHILLNVTKAQIASLDMKKGPSYLRILGFNERGRAYLNRIKHQVQVPMITKISRHQPQMFETDVQASMVYELGLKNRLLTKLEYKQKPIFYSP
ncbi:nucleotidyltransferase [Tepidibacillus decaturensis]|uniref:tRNA(Met) cytidine acetate ligase n=1 Tax=Tepidibacillus decaturensis TaxID=1413211 RepID=A0A135L461_9BACI|nr:nucleotidyltransferase [Tepidibacillus decaturensis]KXG43699.1 hypothetical protein U473_06470 [Tepidibacillus decaturensis]